MTISMETYERLRKFSAVSAETARILRLLAIDYYQKLHGCDYTTAVAAVEAEIEKRRKP